MSTSEKPRKRARTGRGALWIIILLLASSGVIRLTGGTGLAFARGVADFAAPESIEAAPLHCEQAPDIDAVLGALKTRSDVLDGKEAAFADRMAALSLADAEITKRLIELESAENRLAATLALADQAAESDLGRLTAVYESMKPKDAAALFQEMAPGFAAGFLGRMRPDAAAAVMAGLSPQSAYTISVVLAGRNANVPTK